VRANPALRNDFAEPSVVIFLLLGLSRLAGAYCARQQSGLARGMAEGMSASSSY
jgi:hypothetical protein